MCLTLPPEMPWLSDGEFELYKQKHQKEWDKKFEDSLKKLSANKTELGEKYFKSLANWVVSQYKKSKQEFAYRTYYWERMQDIFESLT
jgi:hypothetical protein